MRIESRKNGSTSRQRRSLNRDAMNTAVVDGSAGRSTVAQGKRGIEVPLILSLTRCLAHRHLVNDKMAARLCDVSDATGPGPTTTGICAGP
jgi:hypothetical protein